MATIKGYKVGNDTVLYQDVNLAVEFNEGVSYNKGDYVFNPDDGRLYVFISDHAAGVWTGTDVRMAIMAEEIGNAQAAAEAAQSTAADSAQAAEIARGKVEDAQMAAEDARSAAARSAEEAKGSALWASRDASLANDSAGQAEASAGQAEASAGQAEASVGQAEARASEALSYAADSEAWAVGERRMVPVESTDQTFRNNAKHYSQEAQIHNANAYAQKIRAEAWAVGQLDGEDVPQSDVTYENNSKYYAELAGQLAGNVAEAAAAVQAIQGKMEQIDANTAAIEELMYNSIVISSFAVTPAAAASVEIGNTVDNVNLAYSLNKEPTTLTLDGNDVPLAQSGTINLTNQGLTKDKTYTLVATDSGSHSKPSATSSESVKISFLSKIYYGLGSDNQTITDAFLINDLTGVLASSRKRTVRFDPQGSQYIYFALPQGMCDDINFVVASGAGANFALAVTLEKTDWEHTNASGGKVKYNVYKSMNPFSSSISIEIK